jgi:hypothetical protein
MERIPAKKETCNGRDDEEERKCVLEVRLGLSFELLICWAVGAKNAPAFSS